MRHAMQREVMRALSVAGAPSDTFQRLRQFGSHDWKSSLPWLRHSALELLLAETLKSSGRENLVPADVLGGLKEDASCNRRRLIAMKREFEILIGLLEESKVPYAVLKGFALVPDFCPVPELRSQYDFDFLIDRSDLPRLTTVLRCAGFVQKRLSDGQHPNVFHHVERRPHPPSTLAGIFSPELHRSVEVHCQLWQPGAEGIAVLWPGDGLRRAVWRNWEGLEFPALASEDALLFQVLHAFRHILNNWCRLSWFYEIAIFLKRRANDESFWLTFRRLIQKQDRLCQCTGVVFELSARLFGAEIPQTIRPLSTGALTPAMSLWVERYGVRSAMRNFAADKYSLLLHELFVDDPKLWRRLCSRRLCPQNRPHAIVGMSGDRGLRYWKAWCRQTIHSLGRLGFHLIAGTRYILALPSWKLELREAARGPWVEIKNPKPWPRSMSLLRERGIHTRKADV